MGDCLMAGVLLSYLSLALTRIRAGATGAQDIVGPTGGAFSAMQFSQDFDI